MVRIPIHREEPNELAKHQAEMQEAMQKALEVLSRAASADSFLGRQRHERIPLPYECE